MNKKQQELYDNLLKKVNEYCLGFAAEDVIESIDALVDTYETPKVDLTSEPLQALQDLSKLVFIYGGVEQYKIIEKALKALEIIKKRECVYDGLSRTTQEEYNLLMEVLK